MEHLEQAVAKLELMIHSARSAQCPAEELYVLRAAQMLITDALLVPAEHGSDSRNGSNIRRLRPVTPRAVLG